ncbi:unnamed protein product, partial [Prorocentrum cordatum]
DVDDRNMQLIEQLRRQTEEYKPVFTCAICLTEHEVEGCCTLPCQHRFCFESLQYHFDIIVRERRLSKLTCPVDGCGCNLRSQESIHIFQQCLSEQTYHKLLEFLTRDDPHIFECKHVGCEERVFLDDGDDSTDLACPNGHRFCGGCEHGPHPGVSCEAPAGGSERGGGARPRGGVGERPGSRLEALPEAMQVRRRLQGPGGVRPRHVRVRLRVLLGLRRGATGRRR